MATHPSILAWRIPRTEEPSRLQSIESQRVSHDLACMHVSVQQMIFIIIKIKIIGPHIFIQPPDLSKLTCSHISSRFGVHIAFCSLSIQ